MKKLKNNKMRKAFSLMELMVVIIIMGLLASIVLPNLIGKSDDAKQKLICVQMKSIAQAVKMYKIDNSNYPSTEEGLPVKYFENNKLPKDSWGNGYIYTLDENNFDIFDDCDIIVEAFDNPLSKEKLVNYAIKNSKYIVSGVGMAGDFSANLIKTLKFGKYLYICGDLTNGTYEKYGLFASRVSITAYHQANAVIRILLEKYEI